MIFITITERDLFKSDGYYTHFSPISLLSIYVVTFVPKIFNEFSSFVFASNDNNPNDSSPTTGNICAKYNPTITRYNLSLSITSILPSHYVT